MNTIVKTLLLSAVGVAFAASAMAADLLDSGYEQAPEIVPVEVGSGWYLRGDVAYDSESDLDGGYRVFCDTCGSDAYTDVGYDDWKIDSGASFGLGFGYQFTDFLRGDVTANYWQADVNGWDCLGLCDTDGNGKAKSWELMANAYVDVGTIAGITPYIGGGLGAVNVSYDDFNTLADDGTGTIVKTDLQGEDSWRFAYALMAGASYDLTQAVKLDVGYRYVNVEDGDMFGFDKFSSGAGAIGTMGKDNGFDRHTIQAGIRYSLF